MEAFRKQIYAEVRRYEWETEKRALEPRRTQFETAFFQMATPEIRPPLEANQLESIKQRIESAWSSLFYPPPDDCAEVVVHDYLPDSLRQEALDFLGSIGLGHQEIQEIVGQQHAMQQRIDELGRKITRLEGIDRDGTLAVLKKDLANTQKGLDDLAERARADDRRIITLEATVHGQKAEFEREKKKLEDSSPIRSLIKKSERVRAVVDEVIPALFPLKVKELARAMTDVYQRLAHKDQVARIEILDDGSSRILGKTGKEITFDRSAGENQIFATALIAGLARVSGIRAPLVVDTPLGRLDSRHRANILAFWTEEKSRQVILLSQDEEIDESYFRTISNSVCKTYLLEHTDVGDGIGRTTAIEDEYFAGARK